MSHLPTSHHYRHTTAISRSANPAISLSSLVGYMPRGIDTYLKLVTILAIGLSFTYGYLVNKTVSVTAEYSVIESQLVRANNHLTTISSVLSDAEAKLEASGVESAYSLEAREPSGFVSRDSNSGFSYNFDTREL